MTPGLPPADKANYSHSYVDNGWHRSRQEKAQTGTPDILTFETGKYGLKITFADLQIIQFCSFEDDDVGYYDCLQNLGRFPNQMEQLVWLIQITIDGVKYRAVSSAAGTSPYIPTNPFSIKPLNGNLVLWEAGKVAQRYEVKRLKFLSAQGVELDSNSSLHLQVWPDAFSMTLEAKPPEGIQWDEVLVDMSVGEDYRSWLVSQCLQGVEPDGTDGKVTLLCNTNNNYRIQVEGSIAINVTRGDDVIPTEYNRQFHCWKSTQAFGFGEAKIPFATKHGNQDIREYDELLIDVQCLFDEGEALYVPYVFHIINPANITGMVPMICTSRGIPTGIPVQLSKNWHDPPAYAYLYCMLPVSACTQFMLRISYGFYGKLCSASHSQLCLYGWGRAHAQPTGRWEQLAIGCFGETFCMDPEMSCNVQNRITDVRGLMFRDGLEGKRWGWTACAWGGDWMKIYQDNVWLQISRLKVAYLAHGPCLTDVRYQGFYGEKRQVGFAVRVRTARTDDYARTFLTFSYHFHQAVTLGKDGYLHMVLNRSWQTPTIAFGNRDGLLEEKEVEAGLVNNESIVYNRTLKGEAPFWFSFPDSSTLPETKNKMPEGTKQLIIRMFYARVGGRCYSNPAVTCLNENVPNPTVKQGDLPSGCLHVNLPDGVRDFTAGDLVQMDVEWMTNPLVANNYYGPNDYFRSFLSLNPQSWRIPYREVQLNGCHLQILPTEGATLTSKYPLTVRLLDGADGCTLMLNGGVGGFPMEFTNLLHISWKLFKVEKGEKEIEFNNGSDGTDYWQTDYDTTTGTFTMVFNPVLGGEFSTKWKLKEDL